VIDHLKIRRESSLSQLLHGLSQSSVWGHGLSLPSLTLSIQLS
jgi:hypothetical protein